MLVKDGFGEKGGYDGGIWILEKSEYAEED